MIINGNALDKLKEIDTKSVDLICTDPPYGYSFMNKDWDKAVVSVEIWKECLRVLKSGAFAFVMSSPRQDVLSRMIINLQDAGFVTSFTSIYWIYFSGFPKAANISKLVDKKLGVKREITGTVKDRWNGKGNAFHWHEKKNEGEVGIRSKPATVQAERLNGSYAGFNPKPALEVIITVMKPLSEKNYTNQALINNKGVTWLDNCRIPHNEPVKLTNRKPRNDDRVFNKGNCGLKVENLNMASANPEGRFPANLLVSDDALNGNSKYFSLDKWYETQFIITPKASTSERNKGLDDSKSRKVNDGRKTEIDNPFQRGETVRKNFHPTVKPIKLMAYLITLGSREGDLVLDPFCGSGTTLIAAKQLNRRWVGIELNKEYIEIAQKRISYY